MMSNDSKSSVSGSRVQSSYPGGKSGSGIHQRLINLIPAHRQLIVPFAGRCGVTRKIKPAEHTVLIDRCEKVLQWWDDWQRTPAGRAVELHHCDGIEWLRFRFGLTEYSAAGSSDGRSSVTGRLEAATPKLAAGDGESFVFCDPPYVLSARKKHNIYDHEMSDDDHGRLVGIALRLPVPLMLCGYESPVYAALQDWSIVRHKVMGRRGLNAEAIWMNYLAPSRLHDTRYLGNNRRERERIRRRQRTVRNSLAAMGEQERAAMLDAIAAEYSDAGSGGSRSTMPK